MQGDGPSIQEQLFATMTCFGCGPANEHGLRLRSFPTDDGAAATFTPWPEHDNGLGYLNGGIICTILDCHSAAVVFWEAEKRGWGLGPGGALSYVTAGLDVKYLRPCPLDAPITLHARLTEVSEPQMTAHVEAVWEGKTRAAATAVWKRWRPRPTT